MHMLPYGKETLVILTGYVLGCFTTGYYLVRMRTGQDVRLCGSGSVGATNVARVIGPSGFIVTVLLDFLKGLLAVWMALYLRANPVAIMLTTLAVVMGHLWPAQLHFRGGKGVATSLGALLMYDYFIVMTFVALFAAAFAVLRNFVLAGMLAFAVMPLVLFAIGFPLDSVFGSSALALLILIAHRKNIPEEIHALSEKRLKDGKRVASK